MRIMNYILYIDIWRALLLALFVILVMSAVFYTLAQSSNLYFTKKTIDICNDTVVLFITAHPDDECMFFGPTVLHTTDRIPRNVHLLCLTTGNFYKKGSIRQNELHRSCKVLGIPASNIQILDNSSFLDGSQEWDFHVLLPELLKYYRSLKPDYIFTFDNYGVSGHTNHIATSDVVRQLYKGIQSEKNVPVIFELESVSLHRKYLSFLDTPMSVMSSSLSFVSSPSDVFKAQRAMFAHKSQLVWFRWLYIIFSRYMLINTFKEVSLECSPDS